MQKIRSFFIHGKAWQLFVLMVGLPLIGQLVTMPIMMAAFMTSRNPEDMRKILASFGLVMCVLGAAFMLLFLGWLYILGTELNKIVRKEIRLKKRFFDFSVIYPFFYFLVFMSLWILATSSTNPLLIGLMFLVMPFHLFAMFCMFYLLNFVSKNLVMAERKEPVKFYDYAGPFFLLWFFPVGIWIIQPKINLLFREPRQP